MSPLVEVALLTVLLVSLLAVRRHLAGLVHRTQDRPDAEREVIQLNQRLCRAREQLDHPEPESPAGRALDLARTRLDEMIEQAPAGVQPATALAARSSVQAVEVMAAERRQA